MTTRSDSQMLHVEVLNGSPDEMGRAVLLSDVIPRLRTHQEFPYRFVCDNRFRREVLEQFLLQQAPGGCPDQHVISPELLVDELVGPQKVGRVMRLATIVRLLKAERSEKRRTTVSQWPGYIDALCDFVEVLESAGIEPTNVAPAHDDPVLVSALHIYQRYRQELELRQQCSRWGALAQFLGQLRSGQRVLPALELLVLDGRGYLPPLLKSLYVELAKSARRVVVCLDLVGEWDIESGGVSLPVDRAYAHYLGLAKALRGGRISLRQGQTHPREEHRASGLFSAETGDKENDHSFELRSYPSTSTEIEGIAAQVHGLLEQGVDASRILVAYADSVSHAPTLRSLFALAGLRLRICSPRPLASMPLVGAALELLRAATSGLGRKSIQKAFFSPYIGFERDGISLAVLDIDTWARRAAVAYNRGTPWQSRWIGELKHWHATGQNLESEADFQPQITVLSEALELLEAYNRPCSISEKATQTIALWERFQLGRQSKPTQKSGDSGRRQRESALYGREMQTRAALFHLVEHLGQMGDWQIGGAAFLRLVVQALRKECIDYKPGGAARQITLVELDALPHAGVEYVFIGGLASGAPLWQPRTDTLLTDRLATSMPQLAGKLPRGTEDLAGAHYFLGAVVRASQQQTRLSFSRNGLDADDALSPLLHELGRHFELRRTDVGVGGDVADNVLVTRKHRQLRWAAAGATERDDLARLGPSALGIDPVRLERAIRLAEERNTGRGPYCGEVGESFAEDVLAPSRVHSVTALERYQRCPFAYFAQTLLDLEPMEEGRGETGADIRGRMIHEILSEFHLHLLSAAQELLEAPSAFSGGAGAWLKSAGSRLHAVAVRVIGRYAPPRQDLFFEALRFELLSGLLDDERPGTLVAFLKQELSLMETCRICAVELPFGIPQKAAGEQLNIALGSIEADELGALELAGKIRVSGRIDRIDTLRANPDVVVVHDYKTGSSLPNTADSREGRALQLPLYLMALQRAGRGLPGGAAYYRVSPGRPIEHSWVLVDPKLEIAKPKTAQGDFFEALERSESIVGGATSKARRGDFRLVKGCRRCQFSSLCRVESRRGGLPATAGHGVGKNTMFTKADIDGA